MRQMPWWGRIGSKAARSLSCDPDLTLDLRLLFLAIGHANTAGHACFPEGPGGLLNRVDRTTGELAPYGDRYLREIMRKLIDAGALSLHSTLRCLVVTDALWSTGRAKVPKKKCPEHGHQMRWTAYGWSDEDDEERLRSGRLARAPETVEAIAPPAEGRLEVIAPATWR